MQVIQMEPRVVSGFPCTMTFSQADRSSFIDWMVEHKDELDDRLLKDGAILFRGVKMSTLGDFESAVASIASKFVNYVDGFSPRTKLSSSIYTSTEYDPDFYITLHNELSFSNRWPSKLFFFCSIPAAVGGETPIADGRVILDRIPRELLEEFERKGVRYLRNLHGGEGVGPSWQQTYETESKDQVEKFCREGNIDFNWLDDGSLRIIQVKPACINHPITGERVWFNQVDQFHPCHLKAEIYETLMELYSQDEESLPMFGSFGDGSKIPSGTIQLVRQTVDQCSIPVAWQTGDLLMVDNVLAMHGRMPYRGERKTLVSMSV